MFKGTPEPDAFCWYFIDWFFGYSHLKKGKTWPKAMFDVSRSWLDGFCINPSGLGSLLDPCYSRYNRYYELHN